MDWIFWELMHQKKCRMSHFEGDYRLRSPKDEDGFLTFGSKWREGSKWLKEYL